MTARESTGTVRSSGSSADARASRRVGAFVVVSLSALVLVLFGATLRQGLLPDDRSFVEAASSAAAGGSMPPDGDRERVLIDPGSLWRGFVGTGEAPTAPAWPLTTSLIAAERALYGSWEGGFHLTGLLLHAICAGLVFAIARGLRLSITAAALGGLLFVVHPLQAEAVVRVDARAMPLAAALGLAAMATWMRWRRCGGVACLVATCLLGALSLLAHPVALAFPFVLWLHDVLLLGRSRPAVVLIGWMVGALVTASLCGRAVLEGASSEALFALDSVVDRLASLAAAFERVVVPLRLSAVYPMPGGTGAGVLAGALTLALVVTVVLGYRLRQRMPRGVFAAGFTITVALTAAGVVSLESALRDAHLYVALAALAVLIGVALDRAFQARWQAARLVPIVGAGLVFVVLGAESFARARLYASERQLLENAVAAYPRSARAHLQLGELLLGQARDGVDTMAPSERGEILDRSVIELERAVALFGEAARNDEDAVAMLLRATARLARAVADRGDVERGVELMSRAIGGLEDRPGDARSVEALAAEYRVRGRMLEELGRIDEAERDYLAAVRQSESASAESVFEVGRLVIERGLRLEAGAKGSGREVVREGIAILDECVEIDPGYTDALMLQGRGWMGIGQYIRAVQMFERAIEADPAAADPRFVLATAYTRVGDIQEAYEHVMAGLEIDPRHVDSLLLLAQILRAQDRRSQSDRAIENAFFVAPNRPEVRAAWAGVLVEQGESALGGGDVERGRQLALEARRVDDDSVPARLLLARVFAREKRFDDARIEYERAFEVARDESVRRDYAYFCKDAGYALLIAGDRPEALEFFRQAVALMPEDPEFEVLHEIIRNG